MDIYGLSLTAEKPGLLKIEYIEGSDPPVSLVTKKFVAKGDKINYPQESDRGFKISTVSPVVSFRVTISSSNYHYEKIYAYGIFH